MYLKSNSQHTLSYGLCVDKEIQRICFPDNHCKTLIQAVPMCHMSHVNFSEEKPIPKTMLVEQIADATKADEELQPISPNLKSCEWDKSRCI